MSKRDFGSVADDAEGTKRKALKVSGLKKHTLDSDEEESDDEQYNVLDENDIEGEEEGIAGMDGETKLTPFNMKEEMEEGHFDREGHYVWNKTKEISDNWLDNIDWVKVQETKAGTSRIRTLGEDSSSDSEGEGSTSKKFNMTDSYEKILKIMKPGETVKKTLQRLGKDTKISSAERWRRKKAGIVDEASGIITTFTELTNNILTQTGNMNIYEETYEFIEGRIRKASVPAPDDALDMYADDFDAKEKSKLGGANVTEQPTENKDDKAEEEEHPKLMWEFKWTQNDTELQGPYTTEQMHKMSVDGRFKSGVFVKKIGEGEGNFYSSNRIDFDLYL
ncbi:CD2 antigen cytoplasmic tail-binding protein 2 homolog [Lutzomyia longipalpis]|uniref:CD2 antigen cytoplasmic tail-binding protein 2 homolog n=1 Tax=Lutzomyia longipalpis TaxID=7200 RepID=UPI00248470F2|nr:CD2 antigen cytoplasmic tail-binding protein 2 homolog [Lutzomyia longipalpis]